MYSSKDLFLVPIKDIKSALWDNAPFSILPWPNCKFNEKIDKNIFVAGCYNGSGIGVGTLFGEQIAIMAEGENSDEISIIKSRKQPNWLPPQPFLNLGIFVRLLFERMIAKNET